MAVLEGQPVFELKLLKPKNDNPKTDNPALFHYEYRYNSPMNENLVVKTLRDIADHIEKELKDREYVGRHNG